MNQIEILNIAYRTALQPVECLEGLASRLNRWYQDYPEQAYLHPCVINGRAALVCQRGLLNQHADAYWALKAIADEYAVYLKEDSRQKDAAFSTENRRRQMAVVLTFCIGLLATSRSVTADDLTGDGKGATIVAGLTLSSLNLDSQVGQSADGQTVIHLRHAALPSVVDVMRSHLQKQASMQIDAAAKQKIVAFLSKVYRPELDDPATIAQDLQAIAEYFAQYPQAIALIEALEDQSLSLKYQAGHWQTQAFGNRYGVEKVTVYFDTRLGAQFLNNPDCTTNPACHVSPADALLHELLHAKLMLLEQEHYIATGGFSGNLYPYQHEDEVISEENRLYQAMNQLDGWSRPIRHQHSGELLQVSCPVCVLSADNAH